MTSLSIGSAASGGGSAGWRVALASAYCLTFGPTTLLVTSFGAFVQPLNAAFGWPPAGIALAVTMLALVIMVVSPLQGLLIDRFGARPMILSSIAALTIGLLVMTRLSGAIGGFYVGMAGLAVLGIGAWPLAYMKATSSWFSRNLGLALGTANAGIGAGAVLVAPICSWVIASHGWRAGYLAEAAMAASTFPVAALLVRAAPATSAPVNTPVPAPERTPWTEREFIILALGFFLIGISGTGLLTNLIPAMLDAGLSVSLATAGMIAFGAVSLGGRFISGYLLDHLHARHVAMIFICSSLAGLALFALHGSGLTLVAAAAILGLLAGGEFDILAFCTRRYFSIQIFGRVYGWCFGAFQLGAATGAAAISASLTFGYGYTAGFWFMIVATIPAAVLFNRLGEYRSNLQAEMTSCAGRLT